jgi:glycosyltransferase involved in cell wall biosynthesis
MRSKTVLAVGRLAPQKDHATLIEAWRRLGENAMGWQLRIFGDGPLRSSLQKQIDDGGLASSVSLAGWVSDLTTQYAEARVFVLPSRYEGFPNALLEAMSAGCVPIASDCPGGSAEVLKQGESGVIFQPGDVDELTAGLATVMSNEAVQRELSREAMARAAQFDCDRILTDWYEVLDGVATPSVEDAQS